jgi:DNA-binding PadR family transcriptional regulator
MLHRHPDREYGRRFHGPKDGPGRDHEHRHGRHRHERDGQDSHGRERGGRRRLFYHGELRLVVLAMIAEQPRHGYEIIKEIEDRVAGTYSPSPGVIYPTLTMLEELGHATVAQSDGKKLYFITPAGAADLAANQTALDGALARMRSVRAANSGGPAPDIIRASENLKLALRLRLGRGPLTEEQIRAIATALDTAAVTIERC